MGQSVKVRVSDLIESIREAKAEAEARHVRKAERYDSDVDKFENARGKALAQAAKNPSKVKAMEDYRSDTSTLKIPVNAKHPGKRPGVFKGTEFDKDIRLLQMATADSISISATSNFFKYV